ncbi:(d)CMP kinase [Profundibacterium mesophilum]|uniref:Cytidylate kinase n=1 Tax=Profundibacterium mesophilum KAUST100406-0324 TaxID=1037889 RepID=A0A921NTD5_9RHOB|nr:d(CMP) kinase [Profundibacterium mesophilum]KAF0676249.1 Cytidylate kinase [Profundibacterium mesophilum KAUST100406-0324]
MSITVAIDGPAASGKGTLARKVATHFGLAYLDTGLLYRAAGMKMLDGLAPIEAARKLSAADLERPDLRSAEAGRAASRVAADGDVRAALLDFQRAFAHRAGGAVLDGRDIGTVICPGAEVKIYVTASEGVRARRRHAELTAGGAQIALEDVQRDLAERDARDRGRASAPLRPAEDAVQLDTTELSIEDAVARAVALVAAHLDKTPGTGGR